MKEAFLLALEKSAGVITPAAKAVGVSREAISQWRREDKDFDDKIRAVNDIALDFAETALMKNIQAGDTQAIKFYLSTKGRDRGYVEKQVIDGAIVVNRPRVVYEDDENANQD